MKNKIFLLLVIIAVVGIAAVLNYGKVWAQADMEIPEPFDSTKSVIWVEFSNYLDRQAVPGGGAINGLDPLQVLFTTPFDRIGLPNPNDDDALDFGEAGEVDALANIHDALFGRLIANNKAGLLVSFLGDPDYNNPPTNIPKVTVYIEHVAGNNPLWTQVSLNNPNTPPPQLEDLDGLQLWGFEGYANMHSLQGDAVTSVFYWNGAVSAVYVPLADIVAAVQSASLDPGHYVGSTSLIDLDGLMVNDNGDHVWNSGDTIIFSIRNTIPGGGNWDGGEIVVLPFIGKPNSAFYLNHGGHLWNTAFQVASTFHLDPPTEEVDAIEAYPPMTYGTPTLTQWGLIILVALIVASGVFIALRRRKAAVPA